MTEKLKQTIKEGLVNLPKESRDVISSFGWEPILEKITQKYFNDDEEANNFQIETVLVMLGLAEGKEYIKNIEENVGTSKEEAEKIKEEVTQQIFIPISEKISKNLKETVQNRKTSWQQTINFILSGGNYMVFLDQGTKDIDTSSLDIKNKFVI